MRGAQGQDAEQLDPRLYATLATIICLQEALALGDPAEDIKQGLERNIEQLKTQAMKDCNLTAEQLTEKLDQTLLEKTNPTKKPEQTQKKPLTINLGFLDEDKWHKSPPKSATSIMREVATTFVRTIGRAITAPAKIIVQFLKVVSSALKKEGHTAGAAEIDKTRNGLEQDSRKKDQRHR
jgi:hypothetical protein